MKIIEFKQQNCVYAETQPEYLPLPSHKTKDGEVTSCWGLTIMERLISLELSPRRFQIESAHSK